MGTVDMMASELIEQLQRHIELNDGMDMEVNVWTRDEVKWKIKLDIDGDGYGYENTTICIDAIERVT
jgi:hypothetical protein